MPTRSFRRKKRFGQHFLNSSRFAARIVDFAEIEDEVVLEIGSGKGILTKLIAERAKKIFAVEIDKRLVEILKKINRAHIHVINDDFLKLDLRSFNPPIIIGNIPYSITRSIIEKLIKERDHFKRAVLTVQKEYGQRLCASVGSRPYNAVTLLVNYYFHLHKGFAIPARFFSPQPQVSSIVISLTQRRSVLSVKDEDQFFTFIKGIFRYRRKSLRNALVHYLHRVPYGIDGEILQKRPAMLTFNDFKYLYDRLMSG